MITDAHGAPWIVSGARYEYQGTIHAAGEELPAEHMKAHGWELAGSSVQDGAWEGEPRKGFTYEPGAGRWQGDWPGPTFAWVLASWRRKRP